LYCINCIWNVANDVQNFNLNVAYIVEIFYIFVFSTMDERCK
jgi:hypothetical protein